MEEPHSPELRATATSSKGRGTGNRFSGPVPPLRGPSRGRPGDARARSHAVLDRIEASTASWETSELVDRAQRGEELAFAELYARFFDRVYRYLLVALKNPDDAQEVSQDVFLRALSLLDRYEASRGEFRDWLFSMVRSLAIDHLRRGARVPTVDPADTRSQGAPRAHYATSLLERLDPDSRVRTLTEKLPELQRRVLALRFVFQLSTDEIAAVVGCTPAAVRQVQYRALKALSGGCEPASR